MTQMVRGYRSGYSMLIYLGLRIGRSSLESICGQRQFRSFPQDGQGGGGFALQSKAVRRRRDGSDWRAGVPLASRDLLEIFRDVEVEGRRRQGCSVLIGRDHEESVHKALVQVFDNGDSFRSVDGLKTW